MIFNEVYITKSRNLNELLDQASLFIDKITDFNDKYNDKYLYSFNLSKNFNEWVLELRIKENETNR